MCLIVVKNGEGEFTLENFERSVNRNSDGMGIMWLEEGRVKVERVLGSLEQQRKVYRRHMTKGLFVLHHRMATHGAKTPIGLKLNCHPYKIMDMDDGDAMDIYMVHNGVINNTQSTDNSMSDTWNFIENHIKPILKADPNLLWTAGVQMMITNFIGSGSKLVFLTNHAEVPLLTFNKPAGSEVNGCWLSNTYSIAASTNNTNYNNYNRSLFENKVYGSNYYNDAYDNEDWDAYYTKDKKYDYTPHTAKVAGGALRYKRDNLIFDSWADLKKYVDTKELTDAVLRQATDKKDPVVTHLPAIIDQHGNELFKKKDTSVETNESTSNSCNVNFENDSQESEESVEKSRIELRNELRDAFLDGTMSLDDIKEHFTDVELAELVQEFDMDEADDGITEEEAEILCQEVRSIYDPENVDKEQLTLLIEKISKSFTYNDIEILVDYEHQITADILQHLLSMFNSNNQAKAA